MKAGRMIQLSGVIVDLCYRVEVVPAPGTEAIVNGCFMTAGGGFNAMVAARRCGVPVVYAGTLGTGPLAEVTRTCLEAEGIAVLRPRLAGMDQGCCTVLVDRTGERTFISADGADGQVQDADLALVEPGDGDWCLLSGYALTYAGSRDALTRWMAAQGPRARLVFDPCPQVALIPVAAREAALAAALWISANAAEAAVLTGQVDPAAAAEVLAKGRPLGGGAVVRVGKDGCYLALAGQRARHVPGYRVTAIDTNGAGDAHVGCFIAMLAQGKPAAEAAQIANVCAALSTLREGPATAPDFSDVLAALGRAGSGD